MHAFLCYSFVSVMFYTSGCACIVIPNPTRLFAIHRKDAFFILCLKINKVKRVKMHDILTDVSTKLRT